MTGKSAFSNRGANSTEPGRLGSNESRRVEKASDKRVKTAWEALMWAYADENVRAVGGSLSLTNDFSQHAWPATFRGHDEGAPHSATVRGYLQAHEDAIALDALIWFEALRKNFDQYMRLVLAAERRKPIAERIDLPARIAQPVLHNTGAQFPKPKVEIHPVTRRAYFCPIEWTGYPPDEEKALQDTQARRYALFVALLDYIDGHTIGSLEIRGRGLDEWEKRGRVLTACDESLTQVVTSRETRPEAQ